MQVQKDSKIDENVHKIVDEIGVMQKQIESVLGGDSFDKCSPDIDFDFELMDSIKPVLVNMKEKVNSALDEVLSFK